MHIVCDRDLMTLLLELRNNVVYLLGLNLANFAHRFELGQEVVLLHKHLLQSLLRSLCRSPVVLR